MVEKEEKTKRLNCPVEGFEDAYVTLPKVWLGKHIILRDEAQNFAKEKDSSVEIANLLTCLNVVDELGNIPGIEGDDIKKWDVNKTPIAIMVWLTEVVLGDFIGAYEVPKNS